MNGNMREWFAFIKMVIKQPWIIVVHHPYYQLCQRSSKEQFQKQMVQYLEETERLSQFQCGFRKQHSTQDAVTYFTDCIRKGIDKGCFTGVAFIDMRKVFDSVNHLLLLEKLGKLGIIEHEQRWFSHYLSNRKQSVLYEMVLSEPEEIRSRVPQESILGSILFSLYINDIKASLGKSQVLLYADDAVIHYRSDDIQELKLVLQGNITNPLAWSVANRLSIHPVKTEAVLFGTHQKTSKVDKFELFLGESLVKQVDHYKYLDILIDAYLNFKEHTAKGFG